MDISKYIGLINNIVESLSEKLNSISKSSFEQTKKLSDIEFVLKDILIELKSININLRSEKKSE